MDLFVYYSPLHSGSHCRFGCQISFSDVAAVGMNITDIMEWILKVSLPPKRLLLTDLALTLRLCNGHHGQGVSAHIGHVVLSGHKYANQPDLSLDASSVNTRCVWCSWKTHWCVLWSIDTIPLTINFEVWSSHKNTTLHFWDFSPVWTRLCAFRATKEFDE